MAKAKVLIVDDEPHIVKAVKYKAGFRTLVAHDGAKAIELAQVERVADHATTIAEDVVSLVQGKTITHHVAGD